MAGDHAPKFWSMVGQRLPLRRRLVLLQQLAMAGDLHQVKRKGACQMFSAMNICDFQSRLKVALTIIPLAGVLSL